MLGANIDNVGWPQCGEIDVMEYVSRNPQDFLEPFMVRDIVGVVHMAVRIVSMKMSQITIYLLSSGMKI